MGRYISFRVLHIGLIHVWLSDLSFDIVLCARLISLPPKTHQKKKFGTGRRGVTNVRGLFNDFLVLPKSGVIGF